MEEEHVYALPADVEHGEAAPTAAEAERRAVPRDAATLAEMNAKLDAILAALGGKEDS